MNNYNYNNTQAPAGQKEDYLDKALDAAEKKWGGSLGQNPQKNRAVNEKIVRIPTPQNKEEGKQKRDLNPLSLSTTSYLNSSIPTPSFLSFSLIMPRVDVEYV